MRIDSTKNERIKQYAKLKEKKYRDEASQFLIEGEHMIEEALRHQLVDVLFYVDDHPFNFTGEAIAVSQPVIDKLSSHVSQAKYIAVCHFIKQFPTHRNRILLLDNLQDPGNVGTIIRSAVSFGFDQIIMSPHSVDLYNEKVIRSTQGAVFQIPICKKELAEAINDLHDEEFVIYGTAFQNAMPLASIQQKEKMAFVMGNEGQGISKAILDQCDRRIFIEMSHFDSLNVAIAAGILMYTYRAHEVVE